MAAKRKQIWAVRRAYIELAARKLGKCRDMEAIADAHNTLPIGLLPGSVSPVIQQFSKISRDIENSQHQTSAYHNRTLLGEARGQLTSLKNDLIVSNLPYAQRFMPVIEHWLRILNAHIDQVSLTVQPARGLPNPYVCGTPLDANQTVFVGRLDTLTRIEQFMLDTRHAPLLLYGQRRSGKTSLLLNLVRILPSSIISSYVDCQPCTSSSDYAELMYQIIQQIRRSAGRHSSLPLPELELNKVIERPLIYITEWFNKTEELLEKNNKYLLINLDEIEALNILFARPEFPAEAFFNTLRHTFQHRSRMKVILAGSHTLEELTHWSNYLINAQLIKIGYLEHDEARQLVERPIPDFPLQHQPESVRLLLDLSRAHPHLVQLLCYELVTLKNAQPVSQRYLSTPADVEAAAEQVLETGTFFFADYRQRIPAEAAPMLGSLAARGAHGSLPPNEWRSLHPTNFEAHMRALLQRDIIENSAEGYRFQIELVRRWFARNS